MPDKNNRSTHREFDAWVQKQENLAILSKIAAKADWELNGGRLGAAAGRSSHQVEEDQKEILNELIVVIMQKQFQQMLMEMNPENLNRIKRAFINSIKDKNRRDYYSNLYRNANRVLRESDRFLLHAGSGNKPLSFCLVTQPDPPVCRLALDELLQIPFPEDFPLFIERINTRKQLIPLAVYFLEQTTGLCGQIQTRVYLKDFIAWITRNILISSPLHAQSGDEPLRTKNGDNAQAEAQESLFDYIPAEGKRTEEAVERQQQQKYIPVWAANFADTLDEKAGRLFYYRHCLDLSPKEIAARMGVKSSLSYRSINNLLEQLKTFLRPLPWISPDAGEEPDEEAFQFFIKSLCRRLKNLVPVP